MAQTPATPKIGIADTRGRTMPSIVSVHSAVLQNASGACRLERRIADNAANLIVTISADRSAQVNKQHDRLYHTAHLNNSGNEQISVITLYPDDDRCDTVPVKYAGPVGGMQPGGTGSMRTLKLNFELVSLRELVH